MKYRKKPIEVDAVHWGVDPDDECYEFMGEGNRNINWSSNGKIVRIVTLEGAMTVMDKEWIIMGIRGELFLIMRDIFKATYEKVD